MEVDKILEDLRNAEKHIQLAIKAYEAVAHILKAIESPKAKNIAVYATASDLALEGLKQYPKNEGWKEKIFYALTQIATPASPAEIGEYLKKHEPGMSDKRALDTATLYCSALKDKLARVRDGKKFRYSLK